MKPEKQSGCFSAKNSRDKSTRFDRDGLHLKMEVENFHFPNILDCTVCL